MIGQKEKEAQGLRALFEALELTMVIREEVPASIVRTFLGVAMWSPHSTETEPLTIRSLADKVGLPYQTVTRHVQYLSEYQRQGVEGANLVKTKEYIHDRRNKEVSLTPKGKTLAGQIDNITKLRLGGNDNGDQKERLQVGS